MLKKYMKRQNWELLTPLFILSVFILSICKIHDIDAWIHLTMGRLIWNLNGMPSVEPFLYTMEGQPFSYSSWLFGLLYYIAYHFFGVNGIILFKAVTIATAFYILTKDALKPFNNLIVAIAVLTLIVVVSRHRFVERPDTFLMVFLSFTIFSMNAYIQDNKKYIYALPAVHLLWGNSHSSINLMPALFLSFIVGGLMQRWLSKRGGRFSYTPSISQIKVISLIFILSIVTSLISPYFIDQYTFGAQFLVSDWFKRNIHELSSPTWELYKWPYVLMVLICLSYIACWVKSWCSGSPLPSIIHILILLPFSFLAFTSVRFVFILSIVSAPIIAKNISALFEGKESLFNNGAFKIAAMAWVIIYTALTLANIEPFGNREKRFGFGIDHSATPEKALQYMDSRNVQGRIFNSFGLGQYIEWRDFPDRKPFIDGRGYIEPVMLGKMDMAVKKPYVLDELYNKYGFESILLTYPNGYLMSTSGVDLALQNPKWALVYWDDLSLLYLKRGGKYDHVINSDEFMLVKPTSGINRERLRDAQYRSDFIGELLRNIKETQSSKGNYLLGAAYTELGYYEKAINSYLTVKDFPTTSHKVDAYNDLAYCFIQLGKLDESIVYSKRSLSIKEDANMLFNLGTVYLKKQDERMALRYFERALKIDGNLLSVYPVLIETYNRLGKKDDANRLALVYKSKTEAKLKD